MKTTSEIWFEICFEICFEIRFALGRSQDENGKSSLMNSSSCPGNCAKIARELAGGRPVEVTFAESADVQHVFRLSPEAEALQLRVPCKWGTTSAINQVPSFPSTNRYPKTCAEGTACSSKFVLHNSPATMAATGALKTMGNS